MRQPRAIAGRTEALQACNTVRRMTVLDGTGGD